jgi:hypothetical protein
MKAACAILFFAHMCTPYDIVVQGIGEIRHAVIGISEGGLRNMTSPTD